MHIYDARHKPISLDLPTYPQTVKRVEPVDTERLNDYERKEHV